MTWVPADSLSAGPSSEDGSGSEATTDFSSGFGTEDSGGASSPDIRVSAAAELEGSKLPWEMTAAEIAGADALALGIPTPTEVSLTHPQSGALQASAKEWIGQENISAWAAEISQEELMDDLASDAVEPSSPPPSGVAGLPNSAVSCPLSEPAGHPPPGQPLFMSAAPAGRVGGARRYSAEGFSEEERPFACTVPGCSYRATRARYLAEHVKRHSGIRPHKCTHPGCNYSTAETAHLTRHMRVHTGEKPFKCTWEGCNFATAQAVHLTGHMRRHTGEKPYRCPVPGCDYASIRSWHVTRHMKKHDKK